MFSSQTLDKEVFSYGIKSNVNTKICFQTTSPGDAQVLGEPLSRKIKRSQKGLCVVEGEFVQTKIANNKKYNPEKKIIYKPLIQEKKNGSPLPVEAKKR